MLRSLFTPRWLLSLVVAALFSVACVFLGQWQWGRYVDQKVKIDAIAHNYGAAAVPLTRALPHTDSTLTPQTEWTHVEVTGHYLPDATIFVRNRPVNGTYGYEVLQPFDTGSGIVLVDRGWAPFGNAADQLPSITTPATGQLTVTGWLRSGEIDLDHSLPKGQLASINIAGAKAHLDRQDVYESYLVMGKESVSTQAPNTAPVPLPAAHEDFGPHQAYAIQWWFSAPLGFVLVFWALRRERDAAAIQSGDPVRAPRPKKVRIWDEEDY